jgi:enoyl-CoA hydratase
MTTASLPSYEFDGTIATITLDDGKANVFSTPVVETLDALLDLAEADGARALVIAGRPGKFSAGFDLAEMTESVDGMRQLVIAGARWWMRLYGYPMPTVAACTGHALAGGALTLLSCDVRVGADVPAKIGLSEVAIGMTLPKFGVELARDRLTRAAFGRSTMGGQVYDPQGALEVGYLDHVVAADEVLAVAQAEAVRLSALRTGPYGATKLNARGEMIERVLADLVDDVASVDVPKV